MNLPVPLLQRLYTVGSLKNTDTGAQFALKNRLSDAEVTALRGVAIDGGSVALDHVRLGLPDQRVLTPAQVDAAHPLPFPLRWTVTVHAAVPGLRSGRHKIEVLFEARPFGQLHLKVEDAIADQTSEPLRVPRDEQDDYSPDIVQKRRTFIIQQHTGVKLHHLFQHSFDPHLAKGNCENFVGVAQVPIGFAGPLHIHGEFADGEFLIPLATSEGTLIAS
jgi:hydroxymethylglutaryl-CoA reductase (NADPH)